MATSTKKKKPAAKSKTAASHKKKSNTKKKAGTKKKPSKSGTAAKKKAQRKPAAAPKKQGSRKGIVIAVAVLLSVIGLAVLVVHLNARVAEGKKTTVPLPDKEVAWGIDVSSHNGDIDWSGVAKEADFAFVRVGFRGNSEGEINEDANYADNLKEAEKNHVPVGVYFYSQAVNEAEAEEEAEYMLAQIRNYNISLPVVIDFEYPFKDGTHYGRMWDAGMNRKERTALVNAFCNKVREAGYTPGIYASSYIYKSQLIMEDIADDVFIWVADYNDHVTYNGEYDFWQYSESGDCEGVTSHYVDTNYWYTKNRQ